MPYKFNPFTGNLDYYESGGTVPDPLTLTRTLTVDQTDDEIGFIVQASPGQTANMAEWQDSAAAPRVTIGPNGLLLAGTGLGTQDFSGYDYLLGAVAGDAPGTVVFANTTKGQAVGFHFRAGNNTDNEAFAYHQLYGNEYPSADAGVYEMMGHTGCSAVRIGSTIGGVPFSISQGGVEKLGIDASGHTVVAQDLGVGGRAADSLGAYARGLYIVDDVPSMALLAWNGRGDITAPEIDGRIVRFDFSCGNYGAVGPYGGIHIYPGSTYGAYEDSVFVFGAGGTKKLAFATDINSPSPPITFSPGSVERLVLEFGGRINMGDATAAEGLVHINGQTDEPTLIVEGTAAQASNLQEWRDSASTVLAHVDPVGNVVAGNAPWYITFNGGTGEGIWATADANRTLYSGVWNTDTGGGASANANFYIGCSPDGTNGPFCVLSAAGRNAAGGYDDGIYFNLGGSANKMVYDSPASTVFSFRQNAVEKLGIDTNGDVQVADDLYVTGTAYGTLDEADYLHGWETYPQRGDLLFDNSTHIFSFDDNYYYRYKGVRAEALSGTGSDVDLDDTAYRDNSSSPALQTNTLYFIYFKDATAQPYWSDNAWDLREHIPICTIFWSGSAGAMIYECHGARRDIEWHINAHSTIGTRYKNDGGFAQTLPTTATDNQIQIEIGTIFDEDIQTTTAQRTTCRKWYEVSAGVYTFTDADDANTYPYLWNAGTSRIQYPESDNSYTLADVTNSQFIPLWVYATPDTAQAIYVVTPSMTAPYNTLASARNATQPSLGGVGQEFKLLYRWIYRGDGEYQEGLDYRTVSSLPAGGSTTTAASSVTLIPVGNVSSTNVQAAIEELDTEKAITAAGVPTGGTTSQVLKKNSNSDYDMSWSTVAGTGDVVGPASAVSGNFASYNGTTGKSIQDSGESKASLLLAMWPVGAIYTSVVSTNPGTLFGGTWAAFGTGRVLVGIDAGDTDFDTVEETGGAKTVASAGTNAAEAAHTHSVTSNVTSAANTGNEAAHTHTYTQVPNHVHDLYELRSSTTGSASTNLALSNDASSTRGSGAGYQTANPTGGVASGTTAAGSSHNHSSPALTNNAVTSGGGSSHNHAYTGTATSVVQPYIVVYMWKRTA